MGMVPSLLKSVLSNNYMIRSGTTVYGIVSLLIDYSNISV